MARDRLLNGLSKLQETNITVDRCSIRCARSASYSNEVVPFETGSPCKLDPL